MNDSDMRKTTTGKSRQRQESMEAGEKTDGRGSQYEKMKCCRDTGRKAVRPKAVAHGESSIIAGMHTY